jgi:hypothetical protein
MSLYKKILKSCIFLFFAVNIDCSIGQSSDIVNNKKFSELAVRTDLKQLYQTLQASHYDLYVHQSRQAYDRYYRKTLNAIDKPMSKLDIVRLFMPFVAFGKIGHARIDFPIPDYVSYVRSGGKLLPFDIKVDNGHTFITQSYTDAIQPGVEILSINDKSINDWLVHLGQYVSAERPYMTYAQLETYFPRLLWLDMGQIDVFEVSIRKNKGNIIKIRLDAINALEVEQKKSIWESALNDPKAEVLNSKVAYLRPGPFYSTDKSNDLVNFKKFINDAFNQFNLANSKDLILDLRNNPGGDNSFSDPMIAWFANRAFKFTSNYSLKSSAETLRVLAALSAEEPEGISSKMYHAMSNQKMGDKFAFEISESLPRVKSKFSGRVWALINRHSYSNATLVAAIIQDYQFGTILGEETSDLPTSYASSAKFKLQHSGIDVTYPKGYFVRPSGETALSGVIPDHIIEYPIIITNKDTVLKETLDFVLSQRQ